MAQKKAMSETMRAQFIAMGLDPDHLPPFLSMGPLTYDPLEIENQMYMFDKRCVGCAGLSALFDIDRDTSMGEVYLDGRKIDGCFWLHMVLEALGLDQYMLEIPVHGLVEYDKEYTLVMKHFHDASGEEIPEYSAKLRGIPAREEDADEIHLKHDDVAFRDAAEGMVLLKNDNHILPLPKDSVLNLFGAGITDFRISAIGAGKINPRFTRSLREAVRDTSDFTIQPDLDEFYRIANTRTPGEEILKKARAVSDTGIVIITRGTGENQDNQPLPGQYYLSQEEKHLLHVVSETFEHTVVILNVGYPIDLTWIDKYGIEAVLYAGIAGQAAQDVLMGILDGRINPSGHLTDSLPYTYEDNPANANFYAGDTIIADDPIWVQTCYEEGIYVGYRYYETFGEKVAFPFGYGLSYTDFKISSEAESLTAGDGPDDDIVRVTAKVTNTGSVAGKEVVQVYAKLPGTLQEQPARQLVGYQKTKLLAPGETEEIMIPVGKRQLATCDAEKNQWILEAGSFEFYVGDNVRDAAPAGKMEVPEQQVLQQLTYHLPSPVPFETISQKSGKKIAGGELTKVLGVLPDDRLPITVLMDRPLPGTLEEAAGVEKIAARGTPDRVITYTEVKADPTLLDAFIAQMTDEELARFNVMYGSGWSMNGKGEAGRMAPSDKYGFPDFICADGNSGVNLRDATIGMPTSVVTCQTWNALLAEDVGRSVGEEARENGVRMILATAMNIHRAPLCGRQPEYFSEDPYLAGTMAGYQVRGLHDAGVSDSVKHVLGNNCETARKRNHSLIDERALREIYLRAFETEVRTEMPDTIMTAYNAVNGSMSGDNAVVIDGIFREEFGFDGFAMTDWNSYDTVDYVSAAKAGICWLTPGENDGSISGVLEQAVKDGTLDAAVLRRNMRRVVKTMIKRDI